MTYNKEGGMGSSDTHCEPATSSFALFCFVSFLK